MLVNNPVSLTPHRCWSTLENIILHFKHLYNNFSNYFNFQIDNWISLIKPDISVSGDRRAKWTVPVANRFRYHMKSQHLIAIIMHHIKEIYRGYSFYQGASLLLGIVQVPWHLLFHTSWEFWGLQHPWNKSSISKYLRNHFLLANNQREEQPQ